MLIYDGFATRGSLISEKYDGICAIWDGQVLRTRDGRRLAAPAWFTAGLPDCELRGELWCGRGLFERTQSICMSRDSGERWRSVKYMVFTAPEKCELNEFSELVERWEISDVDGERDRIVAEGGEGIVIRRPDGVDYKHKPVSDDDAKVIGHANGTGKNAGRCGSLIVQDREGREFRIGNGLSDFERDDPPQIGTVIEFQFEGRTRTGKPRFARFIRVRAECSYVAS